jgi:hypothetical protein
MQAPLSQRVSIERREVNNRPLNIFRTYGDGIKNMMTMIQEDDVCIEEREREIEGEKRRRKRRKDGVGDEKDNRDEGIIREVVMASKSGEAADDGLITVVVVVS